MTAAPDDLLPFLAARRDALEFDLAFSGPFDQWQQRLRTAWRASLPAAAAAVSVESAETSLRADGSTLRRMTFRYGTGATGSAALLLPANAVEPLPAVVLMHDHGGHFEAGWRKSISDGVALSHHYFDHYLGDDLLAAGFAVLSIDALGWGSRNYGGAAQQQAVAYHALQLGWSLAGIVAADDLQSIAWLRMQPEIDPARIGVMGFSFGGYRAWQAAALSQDVAACVSLSWIGRRQDMLSHGNPLLAGNGANYFLHPAMALSADYPDLAGLGADRPMFMRAGNADRHMPQATVEAALAQIRTVANAAGGVFDAAIFDGGHVCPPDIQADAIAFLTRHLGPIRPGYSR